jgi:Na+/melibiose symporter-like transporter
MDWVSFWIGFGVCLGIMVGMPWLLVAIIEAYERIKNWVSKKG